MVYRIILYFSAVSGMIIGSGYIFQAGLLVAFIYIILHNNKRLLNYIDSEHKQSDDNPVENI